MISGLLCILDTPIEEQSVSKKDFQLQIIKRLRNKEHKLTFFGGTGRRICFRMRIEKDGAKTYVFGWERKADLFQDEE